MAQTATTKTIPLAYPIVVGERTIPQVTIRRAKARDFRALDEVGSASELIQSLKMIELLTGLSSDEVDEMDAEDFATVGEAVAAFFGDAPGAPNGGK